MSYLTRQECNTMVPTMNARNMNASTDIVDESLLDRVHEHAVAFLRSMPDRHVGARASREELLSALRVPLSQAGESAAAVVDALAAQGDRGALASAGPPPFCFGIGGR